MKTPTSDQRPSAAVLSHPAFDRPPVHNERRRGTKKGCPSLAVARRRRNFEQRQQTPQTSAPPPSQDEAFAFRVALAHELGRAVGLEFRAKDHSTRPTPAPARPHEDAVISAAIAILRERLRTPGQAFDSPTSVKEFMCLQLAEESREVFGVLFLDPAHALIEFEVLFQGTLQSAAVHPREIARRALELNAAAVILAHNHPSGSLEPSLADKALTVAIRTALGQLEIRTLDHIIVGGCSAMSFAERGLL